MVSTIKYNDEYRKFDMYSQKLTYRKVAVTVPASEHKNHPSSDYEYYFKEGRFICLPSSFL